MKTAGNIARAQDILKWFASLGVSDICICPGGRNAPFVVALQDNTHFSVTSAFDERAAGFFTFGRAYSQRRPAIIITTSGTAAAEVLPSVIEAFYTGTPLVVVSADRPRSLRGTGSPQVIDQVGLFGNYVEKCIDIDWNESWSAPQWSQLKPLHINISFDEPLLDGPVEKWASTLETTAVAPVPPLNAVALHSACRSFNSESAVPLLVVGPLHVDEVPAVEELCKTWPGLLYIEAASGLREKKLCHQLLSGEKFLSKLLRENLFSGVLRMGGVPTFKLWRELETAAVPVTSLSGRDFAGMARGQLILADLFVPSDFRFDFPVSKALVKTIIDRDQVLFETTKTLLKKYPQSEPALIQFVSQSLAPTERVYLGNSLPIREWDAFATLEKTHHLMVNRGANGIDGQIASALGMSRSSDSLSIVLGDLTAMYDATGLWFKEAVDSLRLFVVNNNGGRIFERLFKNTAFYNSHSINLAAWAKMWNMKHFKVHSSQAPLFSPGIYELLPDPVQTQNFWDEYDQSHR